MKGLAIFMVACIAIMAICLWRMSVAEDDAKAACEARGRVWACYTDTALIGGKFGTVHSCRCEVK